ncbi:MAG: serine hydrolase domain-containing protein [Bacteroidota bacterium]
MKYFLLLLLCCGLFTLALPLNAQDIQPAEVLNSRLNDYLSYLSSTRNFSGEILVAQGDEILFQNVIGLSSRELGVDIQKNDRYKIASISKSYCAALILKAQEEERIEVSNTLGYYLDDITGELQEVNIHELLSHTSGLPHNEGIADYWRVKSKLAFSKAQIITELNSVSLLSDAGSQYHYSSLNYLLLSLILEEVYGKPYEEILREKILNPLALTATASNNGMAVIPHMTNGYHLLNDSVVQAPYRNYSLLQGAGDLYSNATDLWRWDRLLWEGDFLSAASRNAMFRTHQSTDKEADYGYAWYIADEGIYRFYHGGGTWGYSSLHVIYPELNLYVLVLSNVASLPMDLIEVELQSLLLDQTARFRMETVAHSELTAVELALYEGRYLSDSGQMALSIKLSENQLYAQLGPNPPFAIYPRGQQQFIGKKVNVSFTFELANEQVFGITAKRMGQTFHFKRQK